jgi:hypothetical protein
MHACSTPHERTHPLYPPSARSSALEQEVAHTAFRFARNNKHRAQHVLRGECGEDFASLESFLATNGALVEDNGVATRALFLLLGAVTLRNEEGPLLEWIRFLMHPAYDLRDDSIDARGCTEALHTLYGERQATEPSYSLANGDCGGKACDFHDQSGRICRGERSNRVERDRDESRANEANGPRRWNPGR